MRLIWLLLLLSSSTLSAQELSLKGKVVDEKGTPLSGASVNLKGTPTSGLTDTSGIFQLRISKLPATLVVNSVGFVREEYKVSETDISREIIISLSKSEAKMEEVVVVGYASERRVAAHSFSTASTALKGKVAGVAVASPSIRIRGYSKEMVFKTGRKESESLVATDKAVASVPNVKAKLLTAGELSDFKKWKLWNNYNADEFKRWSRHWGMTAKTRFCVQVQNEGHKALAGQTVYLLNQAKDTVWQTVTDNTGKAELWASFSDTTENKKAQYSIVCGQSIVWSPTAFENGVNRIVLKTNCNSSNNVDIAFVVDATGSMADEIQYLQAELKDIAEKVTSRFSDVQFKWGSVFYRDETDAYVTRHLPLQKGATPLIEFINEQSAGGGGDFPEAVDAALNTALDSLGWSGEARSRILFLVLDAPPHDEAKDRMNQLVIKAAKKGVRIVPIVGSGIDKSTEYLMRCIALATNGSYVFLTDDSGIGGKHIKPTTDEFKVELLNDLLQRVIEEMIYLPACNAAEPLVRTTADSVKQIVKVQLFPNPTSGRLTLRSSQPLAEVYLTDFAGKILFRITNQTNNQYTADLSNYPSGTYLIKYLVKEKGWGSEKILVVH